MSVAARRLSSAGGGLTPLFSRSFSTQGFNGLIDAIGEEDATVTFVSPLADNAGNTISHPMWSTANSILSVNRNTYGSYKVTDQVETQYYHSENDDTDHAIYFDFGAGRSVTVNHYAIRRRESTNSPSNWVFQGSNDPGSGWETIDTQVSNTTMASNNWFDSAVAASGPWRYLRITGSDTYLIIGDVEFYGDFFYDATENPGTRSRDFFVPGYDDLFALLGTASRTAAWVSPTSGGLSYPVTVSASSTFSASYPASDAIVRGGESTNFYHGGSASGGDWWKVDFGSGYRVVLDDYALQCTNGRLITDWTLEGSNDDTAWTTLDTVVGDTQHTYDGDWASSTVASTTPWRYLRVTHDAATYFNLAYIALYGTHQAA